MPPPEGRSYSMGDEKGRDCWYLFALSTQPALQQEVSGLQPALQQQLISARLPGKVSLQLLDPPGPPLSEGPVVTCRRVATGCRLYAVRRGGGALCVPPEGAAWIVSAGQPGNFCSHFIHLIRKINVQVALILSDSGQRCFFGESLVNSLAFH